MVACIAFNFVWNSVRSLAIAPSARIGVRLIAVFTIQVRLHITGAARQQNAVEVRQQFRQHFRLRQRVRQGDRQAAGGDNGIQVLFLQGLCEVPV